MTDKEALAINQDVAGKQGYRALSEPAKQLEIWVKPLSNGEWAMGVLNTGTTAADLTVEWDRFGPVAAKLSNVRDIWAKKSAGDTSKPTTFHVASHDVALLRLTPVK
jgi:alpha-galactosidase